MRLVTVDTIMVSVLDRQKLINMALLCGSDYTDGLQGLGPVGAMELMSEFQGSGLQQLENFRYMLCWEVL